MLWTAAVNLNVEVIKTEVQSGLSEQRGCLDTGRDCCLTSTASVPQHHTVPGQNQWDSMRIQIRLWTRVSHTEAQPKLNVAFNLQISISCQINKCTFPFIAQKLWSSFNISDSSVWISLRFEVISTSVQPVYWYQYLYNLYDVMHKLCFLIIFI